MKYNDNGEYKDIYVKTFDTLPVGAIVEYSGSTIPSGWTDIGNDKIQKTSQYMEGGASLSNVYGTSDENGYTQEYINGLQTPTVSTVGSITFMKIGHIVIMNGKLPSNAQEGTVTLPYTSKYYFGFGFTGYFPANGNTQAYGYAVAEAGSTTLKYRASAAFTDAPISSIYYTDD